MAAVFYLYIKYPRHIGCCAYCKLSIMGKIIAEYWISSAGNIQLFNQPADFRVRLLAAGPAHNKKRYTAAYTVHWHSTILAGFVLHIVLHAGQRDIQHFLGANSRNGRKITS